MVESATMSRRAEVIPLITSGIRNLQLYSIDIQCAESAKLQNCWRKNLSAWALPRDVNVNATAHEVQPITEGIQKGTDVVPAFLVRSRCTRTRLFSDFSVYRPRSILNLGFNISQLVRRGVLLAQQNLVEEIWMS